MSVRWKQLLVVCSILVLFTAVAQVYAGGVVNMEFQQAPLVDVFQILGQLGGYNVLVDPSVSGDVSFVLNDLTVEEALDLVTRTTGYRYQLVGNTLVVASAARLKTEFGTEDVKFVSLKYVEVEAAQRLVSLMVPGVRSYVDPALDLVILYGVTSDLEVAEQVLLQYDQQGSRRPAPQVTSPAQPIAVEDKAEVEVVEEELVNGSITLLYAEGAPILDALRQGFPQREFAWNEPAKMLTGRATSQEWEQVNVIVREFDYPDFLVKGILSSADQMIALIEYQGRTNMLKVGEALHGWTVRDISAGTVEFAQGSRSFSIRLGR